MARPQKAVVDYFPHVVRHGKSMMAIESRFGNDGYCFWFKLLEVLGESEGHVFDCKNPINLEYLLAKTHLSEDTVFEILDLLAKINSIDRELWGDKIVWCQNFVDGVADVYKRRKVAKPTKPDLGKPKPVTKELMYTETPPSGDNVGINPQSKVKESKLNQSKECDNDIVAIYLNNINPMAPQMEIDQILDWQKDFPGEVILLAIQKAIDNKKRNKAYIDAILKNWLNAELKTVAAVVEADKAWQGSKGQPAYKQQTVLDKQKEAELNQYKIDHMYDNPILPEEYQ